MSSDGIDRLISKINYGDNKVIASILKRIKCLLKGKKKFPEVSEKSFKKLVDLLSVANVSVLNLTLSILADICLNNSNQKDLITSVKLVKDVITILNAVDKDEIACRAWRLIGNLNLHKILKSNFKEIMLDLINKNFDCVDSMPSPNRQMFFRAVRKVYSCPMRLEEFPFHTFNKLLKSENSDVVSDVLIILCKEISLLPKTVPDEEVEGEKEFYLQLISLYKVAIYNDSVILCLSKFISLSRSSFICAIEASEPFISHFQELSVESSINKVILFAFSKLCQDVGMRNKVKVSNLLPRLALLSHGSNSPHLFAVFYLFKFDTPALNVLAGKENLIEELIKKLDVSPASDLLTELLKTESSVPGQVVLDNLDSLLSNPLSNPHLKIVTSDLRFYQRTILTDRVWKLAEYGFYLKDMDTCSFAEGVVSSLFHVNNESYKRTTALAVPFLLKAACKEPFLNPLIIRKFLVGFNALDIILDCLRMDSTSDSVRAAVVQLATVFRTIRKHYKINASDIQQTEEEANGNRIIANEISNDYLYFVTDDGAKVKVSRDVLSKASPVLDAMLNGHFVEAGQKCVRLSGCSARAITLMVKSIMGVSFENEAIEPILELIPLGDRFLMPELAAKATRVIALKAEESRESAAVVYEWTKFIAIPLENIFTLEEVSFWRLLSSYKDLEYGLAQPSCHDFLINDIARYFKESSESLPQFSVKSIH